MCEALKSNTTLTSLDVGSEEWVDDENDSNNQYDVMPEFEQATGSKTKGQKCCLS